jgi:Asp-tRNA(Asn)/Glu-tRNA(Gln) amidotransferase A subunit family amidase
MNRSATEMRAPFDRTLAECASAIRERNPELIALVRVLDTPLSDPDAAPDAPLAGVGYVLKDTWDTAGVHTTGGSWRHRDRIPDAHSAVFAAFQRAGAVLLGKSNLCDLAFSVESDNHIVGKTSNPFDPTRTSGGSTGGGAAAVGAGMANFDWGSDFGGSIRMPAAFCGVTGLRLSAATWPIPSDFFPRTPELDLELHGMGPLARSVAACRAVMRAVRDDLATPGPRARTKETEARVVVYGPDEKTSGEWPTFVGEACNALLRAKIPFDIDRTIPAPRVVDEAYDGYLASNFAAFLGTGELPLKDGLAAVALALASKGRLDRRVHPHTAFLLAMLAAGSVTLYRDGRSVRGRVDRVRDAVASVWEKNRFIVAPSTTYAAPRHGRAMKMRGMLAFAKLGNLTDATSIAIPFGRYPTGLPRSIQVLGPPGSEEALLDLAERLEGHDARV